MKTTVKRMMARVLPRSVIQRLRRWHAPRVAARFSDTDWSPAPVIRALVQSGDVVVDIGANMGYITARLADYVGPKGTVYAIEPILDTFEMLNATVTSLGLKQVKAIHACVSNRNGEEYMTIPAHAYGGENLYESRVVEAGDESVPGRRVSVRAVRLDDLISGDLKNVAFIKIDVEGHELAVIQGAEDALQLSAPPLFIEVSGNPDEAGSSAARLFEVLNGYGYSVFSWDGQRLRRRRPGDRAVDYFFLRSSHVDQLKQWDVSTDGRA